MVVDMSSYIGTYTVKLGCRRRQRI